ncbi:uncharacterized protein LOC128871602 [Anastrepha ludens]|uniref:uncharacterized protein LOC128871602 n=1 Tax=Anastrepha ludens TaxID=28586 RepID=UPI0023B0A902|nr:uncharacterized protein LOC128871602 [Anastrepha ludens]
MDRRRFLTIGEIESYINTSSSEDEGIPPADVDAVSDEELIDDNEMITEVPAMTDVCGELEVEHESDVEDFASPPPCSVGILDDGPSCSAQTTRYTAEKDVGGKTPFELFLQFFGEEIMEMLVVNRNMYAHQNNIGVDISKQQIYRFIRILILSGYHKVPHVEHYWSTQQTLGIPIVQQALSRNSFQLIKRIFHLMDNYGIDATDRFAKVRPLIDALNPHNNNNNNIELSEMGLLTTGTSSCMPAVRLTASESRESRQAVSDSIPPANGTISEVTPDDTV